MNTNAFNLSQERCLIVKACKIIEMLEELESRMSCSFKQLNTPSVLYTKKEIEEKIAKQEAVRERLINYYNKLRNKYY